MYVRSNKEQINNLFIQLPFINKQTHANIVLFYYSSMVSSYSTELNMKLAWNDQANQTPSMMAGLLF